MSTLTAAIEQRLRARRTAPVLLWEELTYSGADLNAWSAELATGIVERGVRPGERVAVGLPNSPDLVAAVLAVLRSGAVLVPLNPAYTSAEAGYIVADAGASLVLTHPAQAKALRDAGCQVPIITDADDLHSASPRPGAALSAEDPALIVYTSGTTGQPKGAVLSHRALHSNLSTVAQAWAWTEKDRLLLTLPCFHLHGLALGLLGSLLAGSSIALRPRFVAEDVPTLLAQHGCTMFFGVPTMYNRLVALPDAVLSAADLSRMRLWVSGSAPLTVATFERFQERFGHAILERFGMSEGGFMIAAPYTAARRAGVVGQALPGIDVRIVEPEAADRGELVAVADGEPGELVVRGPNLFSGYWQRPQETAASFAEGYFRTGDLAVREPDGMIRIVGRRSVDIIKSGGFKISAVEIENCLQAHPSVAEVAVIGVPDPDRGEAVIAVVTRLANMSVSAEALREHARAHLAPHKVPARIVFRDTIPSTGPGKFKKRELIAELCAAATDD